MIIDTLENAHDYHSLGTGMRMALDYLVEEDINALAPGRHDLKGDQVYILVQDYQTKPPANGVWEAHRKYVDIQYIAAGAEVMGYAPIDSLEVTQSYIEEKDCLFLSGDGNFVTVNSGMFAVFFTQDAHMPGLQIASPQQVRKAIVKIAV
ncbi:MAG: YhcH/YjgK/YiaL family protein [Lentisphaeria bacterium]